MRERYKCRAQVTDAKLKSRDAASFFFSEMDASVSWEKELRLAAEAVRMKTEEEKAITSGIGTAGRAASSGVDGAMAVPCRWCCLHCVAIYISWYVAFLRAGIVVYSSNSWYQVTGIFPDGYVHTRSSQSSQPESSAREHRTRA